uniref:Uncharacterized protein n=1 Tax=Chromera velia CCMP2878 TaxID=1169474 RepID=A0A0G4GMC3_9ALVE|eukprot:Cvel_22541.t1-p1 / transcript=Cvel_22541.t1 / gene=Cvel_22541 / organism=Chromera_velia_CCMP2878 / gene_product=hypothetical protein / transcript_product=hypothetical protein / location=Cvel_scaffold2225:11392-13748(-) / protein_length=276 / sequence_SO=supercontig / SO=protein_coding / is_pseudo=false
MLDEISKFTREAKDLDLPLEEDWLKSYLKRETVSKLLQQRVFNIRKVCQKVKGRDGILSDDVKAVRKAVLSLFQRLEADESVLADLNTLLSVPSGGARNLPAAAGATVKVKKEETGGCLGVYPSETFSSSAVQMLGPYPMLLPPLERGRAAGVQRLSESGRVRAYTEQEVAEIEQLGEEVTALLKDPETLNFTQVGLKAEIKKFDEASDESSEEEENVSQLTGAALEEVMKKSLTKQKAAKQRKKEIKGKRKQVEQMNVEIATKQGEIASLQDRID